MMTCRRLAPAVALALALALSACSGGSDDTTEANGTSSSLTGATTEASTTTVAETTTTLATTTSTATTSTTAGETTTTTAPTTTTEPENEYALALAPDGLIVIEKATGSTNMLPFGTAQTITVNAVTGLLGTPSESGPGNPECGNGQDAVAIWDGEISLEFAESSFIGWSTRQGSTLTDMAGIGFGSSLASLRSAWAITIDETTLGTEFATSNDGTGYGGLLSDGTESAIVEDLWAGSICAFR